MRASSTKLIGLVAIAATLLGAPRFVQVGDASDPWCSVAAAVTNCLYTSFADCEVDQRRLGGVCVLNPRSEGLPIETLND